MNLTPEEMAELDRQLAVAEIMEAAGVMQLPTRDQFPGDTDEEFEEYLAYCKMEDPVEAHHHCQVRLSLLRKVKDETR